MFYGIIIMQNFFDKTALVIGGSGGIGAAVCRELAKKNCSLIVHGGHESDAFNRHIADLSTSVSVKPLVQSFDIGFAKKFFSSPIIKAVQSADIICICFGPFLQQKLHEMDVNCWQKMIEMNLLLPGLVVSSALPGMIEKKWGRFLFFGGTRTDRVNAFGTNAAYAAAKTAVSSLVRSTALEYAKDGITCNAVFPGFTKTEYMDEKLCGSLAKKMPQKRLIKTTEIALSAVHLLENPMINGALVNIDGGWDPAF